MNQRLSTVLATGDEKMSFKNVLMFLATALMVAVTTQVQANQEATVPGAVAVSVDTLSELRSVDSSVEPDQPDGGDGGEQAQMPWKATGTHSCYKAGTSFRPTCEVADGGFGSCPQAHEALQARDCCPQVEEGMRSFSFSLTTCGPE